MTVASSVGSRTRGSRSILITGEKFSPRGKGMAVTDERLMELMETTVVLPDPVPEPVVRDHGPVVVITERGEARLQRWAKHRLNRWR